MIKRKSHSKSRNQRRNKRRRAKSQTQDYAALEPKQLLAADLQLTNIQFIDGNGQHISSPAVGEQMKARINWATTDLPSNAQYRINASYNGYALVSPFLTTGAGEASATGFYDFSGWYAEESSSISFNIDIDDNVAESSESNNFSFQIVDTNKVDLYLTNISQSLPDTDTTTYNFLVSDSGTIEDLDFRIDISHPFVGDLDVYLESPNGTRVELFTDVGGDGNNFNRTRLDDEATTNINDGSAPFTGRFSPEGNLSDFDGESITGLWTVEITDDAAGDVGTLNSVGITAETSPSFDTPLIWPVGAEAFTEIGVGGYVDVDPTSGIADFKGRNAVFPESEGMLINRLGLNAMDQGVESLTCFSSDKPTDHREETTIRTLTLAVTGWSMFSTFSNSGIDIDHRSKVLVA